MEILLWAGAGIGTIFALFVIVVLAIGTIVAIGAGENDAYDFGLDDEDLG